MSFCVKRLDERTATVAYSASPSEIGRDLRGRNGQHQEASKGREVASLLLR